MRPPPYLAWSASFSVGNDQLDAQHQLMFGILNTLHETLETGQSPQPFEELMAEAQRYAEYHFATEESIISKCGYPRLSEHRLQHDEYVRRIREIQREFELSQKEGFLDLFLFLKEWWLNHLTQVDREYVPFLAREHPGP